YCQATVSAGRIALFFCFLAAAPPEISTLSLHDALPILGLRVVGAQVLGGDPAADGQQRRGRQGTPRAPPPAGRRLRNAIKLRGHLPAPLGISPPAAGPI